MVSEFRVLRIEKKKKCISQACLFLRGVALFFFVHALVMLQRLEVQIFFIFFYKNKKLTSEL